jgi:hypothetical protein
MIVLFSPLILIQLNALQTLSRVVPQAAQVGLYKLNPVHPELEGAWFQPWAEPIKWSPGFKPLLSVKFYLHRYTQGKDFFPKDNLPF